MIVAIDAGNSALKVARVEGADVQLSKRNSVAADASVLVRAEMAMAMIEEAANGGAEGIVLVSVVPAWTAAVRRAATECHLPLLIATADTIPITVHIPHPERVGADRLVDAFAAARLHGVPVIVVDLGTATTVDAVGPDGTFLGGAILPGIELGAQALARGTAQLPQIDVTDLPPVIGDDTPSAIASGLVLGQVGAVRELVGRMQARIGGGATAVVTGGLSRASWAHAWTAADDGLPRIADVVDPELTLRGLGLLSIALAMHAA